MYFPTAQGTFPLLHSSSSTTATQIVSSNLPIITNLPILPSNPSPTVPIITTSESIQNPSILPSPTAPPLPLSSLPLDPNPSSIPPPASLSLPTQPISVPSPNSP